MLYQQYLHLQVLHPLQFTMPLLIVFTLLLYLCIPTSSATTDTILAGQALAVNDKLISSNGRYALGFFKTNSSKSSQHMTNWYLGIWFNTVPKFTPAWVANRDKPIKNITSSKLTISQDGNLVILNQSTIIWNTQANLTRNSSTTAMLLSNGNLILTDSSNPSEVLWQSFDHPTDTLFPGAKLGWDKFTGLNRRIVSWKNLNDPATGVYCDRLDPSGLNQFFLTPLNSSVPYWSTGVWNGKYFASLPEMSGNSPVLTATFVHNDQEKYMTLDLVDETRVTHHVLDVSGRSKQFIWLEGSQDWTMIYAQPKLQCDVYAICGPFTICNDNALPYCNCMEGFTITSPEDWELEDRTGGCSRNTPLDCISNKITTHTTDKFYSVPCVEFSQSAPKLEVAASASECAQVCLSNCSCTAYSFSDERCSIWHNELLNIRALQCSGTTNSTRETLYLRISANDFLELHESCRDCIIHCDIKPENILLDASFVPKVADFGMAKLLGREFSRVLTTMRGTAGYLAPEWITGVAITPKIDVYSYGMLLLEIISGKRNSCAPCPSGGNLDVYFPVYAAHKLLEGEVRSLADEMLHGDVNLDEVEMACKVACWCIQDDEFDRPTMVEVVRILEGQIEIGMPPIPRLLQAMAGSSDVTI